MNILRKLKPFVLPLAYLLFYLLIFSYVEQRNGVFVHMISCWVDKLIPFSEVFIIPYLLWFFYIAAAIIYFGFSTKGKTEYYQLLTTLGIGMTLFLIISLLYPNGHVLRPTAFIRDNIFVDMVKALHQVDTSTNVLPSIHVFNSVAVAYAIAHHPVLEKKLWIVRSSNILAFLIVCSTVFLKQHSFIDVVAALALNFVCYRFIYAPRLTAGQKQIPELP